MLRRIPLADPEGRIANLQGSPDFSKRAGRALARLGEDPEQLAAAIEEIEGVIEQPIPSSRS